MLILLILCALLLASCNTEADAGAANSAPAHGESADASAPDESPATGGENAATGDTASEEGASEEAAAGPAKEDEGEEAGSAVSPGGEDAGAAEPPAQAAGQDEFPLGVAYSHFFNEDRAWKDFEKQLEFGFRVPGTDSHVKCMRWLKAELEKSCDVVGVQEFSIDLAKGPTPFYNIMGRINPDAPRRILLCAHWDTRPTADMNPIGFKNQPIPGANDGASGVAVLLELARVFSERNPPNVGVDILLFDGEDYGPGLDMMFLGSKHFARELHKDELARYNYGILLDMVGDKDLDIHPENHSESAAGRIYAVALEINEDLGYDALKKSGAYSVYDDHLPLIERGMKIYDFIDFNYPYWHTTKDTADKCSKESLKMVGRIMENMIYMHPEIYGPKG